MGRQGFTSAQAGERPSSAAESVWYGQRHRGHLHRAAAGMFARIACPTGKRTQAHHEGMKRPLHVHSGVMARTNDEVAALLSEYADLISIT